MNTEAENDEIAENPSRQHDLKASLAGVAGNVLEWYDFSVYAFVNDIIGQVFFPPSDDPNANMIKGFAVFGVAFLIRPIGGAVFGLMGDNVGRKSAVENSILAMAIPTFAVGILPSYESVGWISPALLITCRIFQGFSVGGQYMSSLVFSLEGAEEESWGMRAAFVFFATTLGAVLGSLTSYILRATLSEEDLKSYGWRIPFFFAALGVIPGLYLKYRTEEIPLREVGDRGRPELEKKNTFAEVFGQENRRALISALLIPMLSAGGYYIVLVWLGVFMESIVHVENGIGINTAVASSGLVLCFLGGWVADRVGPRGWVPLMLISSLIFGIVAPIFINIIGEGDPTVCFFLQFTMVVLLAIYGNCSILWMVSNFPPHVRNTSVAVAYNVSVSVVGGFSPALATFLVSKYNNYAPGYIISVLSIINCLGVWVGTSRSRRYEHVSKGGEQVETVNKNPVGIT